MSEKRKIVIKDVLAMLEDGKSRKEINEFYNLNPREAKEVLWKDARLMHKKPAKYTIGIELVEEEESIVSGEPETMDNPNFRGMSSL